ncbi:MAG: ABC transporter substrate-binding protein [candidate division Zixibacteria bacterium]|nr:ABC transporter substrate-binding protein [candidate division Zixibacteria bacterium]
MQTTYITSRLRRVGWFLGAVLYLLCSGNLQAQQSVAIIYADSSKNTLRTKAGLTWGLSNNSPDHEIVEFFLRPHQDNANEAIAAIKPQLLITIGSKPTAFAHEHFPHLPVVFAKVLNPIESGFIDSWKQPGGHITGASLDIPVMLQMQKYAAIIPGLKKVGVIYTANTRRLVAEAEAAVAKLDMSLVSYEITSDKELPMALDSLCRSVDGIWTVADEIFSSPQFVRYTLLETLRKGLPVMGFSRSFVESGALFCLEPDYKYIGRQAAEIAGAVLRGADPATISATIPDIVYLYLNLKTEQALNLKVPSELVDIAKETY